MALNQVRGALNWSRNLDRIWELMAAWQHAKIMQPALFISGDRDALIARSKAALDRMLQTVPNLRKLVMLPCGGQWTQQERPAEVNAELLAFLKGLG